jgi:hypothetical protein
MMCAARPFRRHNLNTLFGGVAHPLFGIGFEHLDLALDDVQETIHRIADPGDYVAGDRSARWRGGYIG